MRRLSDLIDVVKSLKRDKPSIKVCPRCRSKKIRLSSSFDSWLTPAIYVCENCGYEGTVIMELEKKESKNRGARSKMGSVEK